jgi:ATP-dependent Clp endopeptidase proteolytic subunit ClpP
VLRISGDIIDDDSAWIYEWFGIPSASPNLFREELNKYKGKNITVWIDSYGGDVFAAAGMYNALMEHKKNGAKVTTIIDGKAMSAGTIPYMAGDEKLMTPMSMYMMHNPLTNAYGYASDLRKAADVLDEVKETILNAYELGTGKSRETISQMMDDETYMSAKTALKEGFTDKILYSETTTEPIENNFSFSHMSIQNTMSASMKKFMEIAKNELSANQDLIPDANKNQKQEGKEEMEIKNAAELKAQMPSIYDEAFQEGIKAERNRLKAFDVLNGKVDPEFLEKTKYEDSATAESVLFKATIEGKTINSAYVAQAQEDAKEVNKVEGDSSDNAKVNESKVEANGILNKVTEIAQKTLGIKGGR